MLSRRTPVAQAHRRPATRTPRGLGVPPPRPYRVWVGLGWLWVRMGGDLGGGHMPAPGFAMRVGGAEGRFVWFQMRPLGARAPGALPTAVRGTLWALRAWLYAVCSNRQLLNLRPPACTPPPFQVSAGARSMEGHFQRVLQQYCVHKQKRICSILPRPKRGARAWRRSPGAFGA